jgi:predicted nuclease of predicted toxin-antitoxin system
VRALLDNNLSPRLVAWLAGAGWDVVHVASLGLQSADDETVLQVARETERVLISADTDFGQLLARTRATSPSIVLVRRVAGRRVPMLAGLLLTNLPALAAEIEQGSIVVVGDDSIRVRRLPIA